MHFFAEKDRIMWWILLLMFDLCHFNWEKLNRGVSKPGGFPLFWGKVQIVSQTLSGLFLVGALDRPRKRKRTDRENPRTIPEQIGEIPEKSGKSQKGQKRKDKSRSGNPPVWTPPRLAAQSLPVLASQKIASANGCVFNLQNCKSQLLPQVPQENRRKIAEWNRKLLRLEIANSKSQYVLPLNRSPNFRSINSPIFGCAISSRSVSAFSKSQRFRDPTQQAQRLKK